MRSSGWSLRLPFAASRSVCLTGDTMTAMATASVRDLRNRGGEIIDRVEAGESFTVTRAGRPVADLVPLRRRALDRDVLLARWSKLQPMDPVALRRDLDGIIDPGL